MARRSNGSAIVATRNFFANTRRDGVSFIEFLNNVRTETEAYIEMGELGLAEKQCYGLIKLEKAKGYTTGEKLMKQIKALQSEKETARREQMKVEREERREERVRLQRMNSLFERIAQEVESEARVEAARIEREREMAELQAKRQLRQRAKEDRNVWLAHHEELDNTLTHNPFAVLAGYVPMKDEEPAEVPFEDATVEVQVDVALALYTQAIEACQEMGQWKEVQEVLGDEFFMRNITEELVNELHDAMELVADNQ